MEARAAPICWGEVRIRMSRKTLTADEMDSGEMGICEEGGGRIGCGGDISFSAMPSSMLTLKMKLDEELFSLFPVDNLF